MEDRELIFFTNLAGARTHYYHFLLGIFVPLMRHLSFRDRNKIDTKFAVLSCGPLDTILAELSADIIALDAGLFHQAISEKRQKGHAIQRYLGNDNIFHYNQMAFSLAAEFAYDRLRDRIAIARQRLDKIWDADHEKILVIARGSPNKFYIERGESTGSLRRAVPNLDVVTGCLENAVLVELEGMSLSEQIAHFSEADVVIAQHGAALANMIWCKKAALVMEIKPSYLVGGDVFEVLTRTQGVNYCAVRQEHWHAPVSDPEMQLLRSFLLERRQPSQSFPANSTIS